MAEETTATLVGRSVSRTFRGILHFSHSLDSVGNRQVVYDGAGNTTAFNLGTNTASISGLFEVLNYRTENAGLKILNNKIGTGTSYIHLGIPDPSRGFAIYHRNSDNVLKINYDTPLGAAQKEIITFLSSGNVGIGTDTPVSELQVKGTLTTDLLKISSASGDQEVNLGLYSIYVKKSNPNNLYIKPSTSTEPNAPFWIDTTNNEVNIKNLRISNIKTNSTSGTPNQSDLYRNVIPVGSIFMFPSLTLPNGWFECNGFEYDTNEYADLFNVIGYTYGTGTGTNFRVPDLRGLFVRGLDRRPSSDPNAIDPNRVLGKDIQDDLIKTHVHQSTGNKQLMETGGATISRWKNTSAPEAFAGTVNSDTLLQGNNVGGGSETRPKNLALVYCIKW